MGRSCALRGIAAVFLAMVIGQWSSISSAAPALDATQTVPVTDRNSAVIFAVGHDMDHNEFTGSESTVRALVNLSESLRKRQPNLMVKLIPDFTEEKLRGAYDEIRRQKGRKHVTLVLLAHGEIQNGSFNVLDGRVDWINSRSIGEISKLIPSDVALLNCHAGGARFSDFDGPIFGMVSAERPAPKGVLEYLSGYLEAHPERRFPLNAREWFEMVNGSPSFKKRYPQTWWGPTPDPQVPYEGVKFESQGALKASIPDLDVPAPLRHRCSYSALVDSLKRLIGK